jgi:hypothetical protein
VIDSFIPASLFCKCDKVGSHSTSFISCFKCLDSLISASSFINVVIVSYVHLLHLIFLFAHYAAKHYRGSA